MKRVLAPLCALLLATAPAEASITTTGAGKTPGAAATYTGPGDLGLSSPGGWWGLRAYNAASADGTHKAIQVRRSTDSQTCDVLLTTAGGLGNVASCTGSGSGDVATFCAANCTIITWYDQSGNGANQTQSTVAKQAALVFSCIGSFPCAQWTGAETYVVAGSGPSLGQTFVAYAVSERTGLNQSAIIGDNTNTINGGYSSSANTVTLYDGTATITGTASDNAYHVLQFVFSPAASSINVDAATVVTGNAGTNGWTGVSFLGYPGFSPIGKFLEFGAWGVSAASSSLCHNAYTYWGASTSC